MEYKKKNIICVNTLPTFKVLAWYIIYKIKRMRLKYLFWDTGRHKSRWHRNETSLESRTTGLYPPERNNEDCFYYSCGQKYIWMTFFSKSDYSWRIRKLPVKSQKRKHKRLFCKQTVTKMRISVKVLNGQEQFFTVSGILLTKVYLHDILLYLLVNTFFFFKVLYRFLLTGLVLDDPVPEVNNNTQTLPFSLTL